MTLKRMVGDEGATQEMNRTGFLLRAGRSSWSLQEDEGSSSQYFSRMTEWTEIVKVGRSEREREDSHIDTKSFSVLVNLDRVKNQSFKRLFTIPLDPPNAT